MNFVGRPLHCAVAGRLHAVTRWRPVSVSSFIVHIHYCGQKSVFVLPLRAFPPWPTIMAAGAAGSSIRPQQQRGPQTTQPPLHPPNLQPSSQSPRLTLAASPSLLASASSPRRQALLCARTCRVLLSTRGKMSVARRINAVVTACRRCCIAADSIVKQTGPMHCV